MKTGLKRPFIYDSFFSMAPCLVYINLTYHNVIYVCINELKYFWENHEIQNIDSLH